MSDIPRVDLPEGVVIMDGGMGMELENRGAKEPSELWSAAALLNAPDLVRQVHEEYIRAGARIITTNTYSSGRKRLRKFGYEEHFESFNNLAGELAGQARKNCGEPVLIAGSLPPMDRSYRPDMVHEIDDLQAQIGELAGVLAPHVDFFICETMSTAAEALGTVRGAAPHGKPIWVSWTLNDRGSDKLRSGETIEEAVALLDGLPVSGFLVNCCAAESITAVMPKLAALGDFSIGGYANGFHHIDNLEIVSRGLSKRKRGHRHDITPDSYLDHARDWISAGAKVVGGCCEIGPNYIARLKESLN